MKIVEGWHCPDMLSGPGKYLHRAEEDAPQAIERCKHRRTVIQAGGHVGTWPVFLSKHFERIFTFEPIGDNFRCLVRNIEDHVDDPNIVFAARGALGHKRRPIEMLISGKSSGQHRARYPTDDKIGSVPVYLIDDLNLPTVDAIFLDLEGFENFALRGAVETLRSHRPIVMAENNKRCIDQGFSMDDLEIFMRSMDYRLVARVAEDLIFTPRGKA